MKQEVKQNLNEEGSLNLFIIISEIRFPIKVREKKSLQFFTFAMSTG